MCDPANSGLWEKIVARHSGATAAELPGDLLPCDSRKSSMDARREAHGIPYSSRQWPGHLATNCQAVDRRAGVDRAAKIANAAASAAAGANLTMCLTSRQARSASPTKGFRAETPRGAIRVPVEFSLTCRRTFEMDLPAHSLKLPVMSEQEFLRAAFDGDLTVLRAYAEAGGDVNVTNRHGMSALMLAIWNGRAPKVVEYLVRVGVDLRLRQSSSDWRALTFAAVNGHRELLELLLASGDRVERDGSDWKALAFAIQYRNSATAEILLAHGAPVDARDDEGRTPLMRAARNSDPVALELLLRHGADVAAADAEGNTALHIASGKANLDNIRTLIEHGADPFAINAASETPVDIARRRGKPKHVAAMEPSAGAR